MPSVSLYRFRARRPERSYERNRWLVSKLANRPPGYSSSAGIRKIRDFVQSAVDAPVPVAVPVRREIRAPMTCAVPVPDPVAVRMAIRISMVTDPLVLPPVAVRGTTLRMVVVAVPCPVPVAVRGRSSM